MRQVDKRGLFGKSPQTNPEEEYENQWWLNLDFSLSVVRHPEGPRFHQRAESLP